jgi:hypothetical protein
LDAYEAVIKSMREDGHTPVQIATQLNVTEEEVAAVIGSSDEAATGEPTPAPEPLTEEMPEVADLLTWAAAHDDPAIRAHGEQAAAAVAALRERRVVDAVLNQVTTEINELQERLAALQNRESKLRPKSAGKTRKGQERDYEPSVVRAWGRENGYTVPDRGQIPKKVLEAWRQSNGTRRLSAVG